MSTKNRIIAVSILMAIGFWIADAVIDVVFFSGDSFLDELIFHPSPYEIYIRSLGTAFIVIPGIILSRLYGNLKKTEASLSRSETHLNEAQSIGQIGSWEFDIDKQTIDWSDETYALYERDKTHGPPSLTEEAGYYTPEQAALLKNDAARAIETGQSLIRDIQVTLPSGKTAYYHTILQPIKNANGKVYKISGIVQNITERKQTEEKLKQSEAFFKAVFNSTNDAISIINVDDFTIAGANDAFLQQHGLNEDEVIGKTCYQITHHRSDPCTPPDDFCPLIDTSTTGETSVAEHVHHTWDNKQIYVEVTTSPIKDGDGNTIQVVHTTRNITERKQMENKLADSEVRYRRLFETAQDAILILNGDTGQIIDANPFIKDLLGYSMEELVGKNLWEIGEFKDTLASKISYQQLHESGYRRWDNLPLVARDGRQISVEVVANAYQVDHTRVIQCNIRDMTLANRAMEELREVNQDLKVAQRLTRIGNWKWIIATNNVTWSDELCHINGWDSNIPVPSFADMERFYTPESWKHLNEVVAKALNTGESYELELDQIRTDGTRIITLSRGEADYGSDGKIISLHGTVQDITDNKKAEEKIRESEERYRTLFESSTEGIIIADSETRENKYANPAFSKMLGYSQEELMKMGVSDAHPKSSLEYVFTEFDAITRGEKEQTTLPCLKKDGTVIYADVRATRAIIDGVNCNIGFFTDVTEHKQAEETLKLQAELLDKELDSVYLHDFDGHFIYINKAAYLTHGYTKEELLNMTISQLDDPESARLIAPRMKEIMEKGEATFEANHRHKNGSLIPLEIHTSQIEVGGKQLVMSIAHDITERKKTQEQLIAQDRLASIGQLVSGVAHEINNPLTGVIGFSELLLQKELPDDVRTDLKIINDEAQRCAQIVRNLLTFARKQPGGKTEIQINEQLGRVLALRGHEQKVNNIQANINFAPELPQILGNASQLQQVFFNIIVNAEQAMLGAHGKGTLTVTTEQVGNMARISLADDGPGISPEHMTRLFTPFFTTKEVGKGTGLGLSISNGIVAEHGGRIYAESEPGKGATFIVELPLTKEQANGRG